MSEPATPGVAANDARHPAQALSEGALEAVLADFRTWLAECAAAGPSEIDGRPPEEELPDLHTLLAQFIALRHEVNLQTRAVRNQQEQNAETLRQLGQALEALRAGPGRDQETPLRPLLETLADLHDALARAGREVGRGEETLAPLLSQAAAALEVPEAAPPLQSTWSKLFGKPPAVDMEAHRRSAQRQQAREDLERVGQTLASLVAGYRMSLARIEKALARHGLEPIAAVGGTFDPERMEVVEAVPGSDRPAGEVLDEVRRGYLYQGRVFRYAQVRVARG
jgi:molecular chaperone GrpE